MRSDERRESEPQVHTIAELMELPLWEAHDRILEGLPLSIAVLAANELKLDIAILAAFLGIRPATFRQWRRNGKNRLRPVHGNRLFRLVKILQIGTQMLGSSQAAMEWLLGKQRGLGFRQPIALLTTEAGAVGVEELLTRIGHNVYT